MVRNHTELWEILGREVLRAANGQKHLPAIKPIKMNEDSLFISLSFSDYLAQSVFISQSSHHRGMISQSVHFLSCSSNQPQFHVVLGACAPRDRSIRRSTGVPRLCKRKHWNNYIRSVLISSIATSALLWKFCLSGDTCH